MPTLVEVSETCYATVRPSEKLSLPYIFPSFVDLHLPPSPHRKPHSSTRLVYKYIIILSYPFSQRHPHHF